MSIKKNINIILNSLLERFDDYNNVVIACVFSKTKVLSYGISKPDQCTMPLGRKGKAFSVHAEVDAIDNYYAKYNGHSRREIGKFNLMTIRFSNGKLLPSMSCQFCIKSLKKCSVISKIYYYNEGGTLVSQSFQDAYKNINCLGFSSGDRRKYKY
jgi:hypothetical protein